MQITITNTSKEPIYEQISAQIKKLILLGDLKQGDALPSMRQLAKRFTSKYYYNEKSI